MVRPRLTASWTQGRIRVDVFVRVGNHPSLQSAQPAPHLAARCQLSLFFRARAFYEYGALAGSRRPARESLRDGSFKWPNAQPCVGGGAPISRWLRIGGLAHSLHGARRHTRETLRSLFRRRDL